MTTDSEDTTEWENRARALPHERRAAEMECTCGNTDVIRGKDFIRCLRCKTKTVFEPDDPPSPTAQAVDILRELEARAETPCTHCAGSGVHEVTDSNCLECRGTGKQHVSGATYRQAIQEVLSLLDQAVAA